MNGNLNHADSGRTCLSTSTNDIRILTKAARCMFLSVNTAIRIQNKCSVCLWRFYRNQSNWWILSENTPTRMIEKIRKKCVFCCVDQNALEQTKVYSKDYPKLIISPRPQTFVFVFHSFTIHLITAWERAVLFRFLLAFVRGPCCCEVCFWWHDESNVVRMHELSVRLFAQYRITIMINIAVWNLLSLAKLPARRGILDINPWATLFLANRRHGVIVGAVIIRIRIGCIRIIVQHDSKEPGKSKQGWAFAC